MRPAKAKINATWCVGEMPIFFPNTLLHLSTYLPTYASPRAGEAARARDRQAASSSQNEAEESDETEDEATGERTTRVGPPRGGTKLGPWATAALTSAVFTCRPSRPERWRLVRRASQPGRCGPRVSQLSHSRCVGSPGRRKHEPRDGDSDRATELLLLISHDGPVLELTNLAFTRAKTSQEARSRK